MSDRDQPLEISDAIRREAVGWLVRVQSDQATVEDWTALGDWLERSPVHLRAYEAAERLSAEVDEHGATILAALNPPASVVVGFRPRARRGPTWPPTWPMWAAVATASVVAVFLAPVAWRSYQGQLRTYQTGSGETRTVNLADGSTVRLDVASAMSVRLGWLTRQVKLADAEASFDVAKDAHRPFEITVGDQLVRVVGTEFNIRHYDGNTVITVRRGVVRVYQPDLATLPVALLTKGWSLSHIDGTSRSTIGEVDPNAAFSWTSGQLVCRDQPLSEIVAYLNRRYTSPIQLSPAVAGRRFTGVLTLGAQSDVVRHLSEYLSLSVDTTKQTITLR